MFLSIVSIREPFPPHLHFRKLSLHLLSSIRTLFTKLQVSQNFRFYKLQVFKKLQVSKNFRFNKTSGFPKLRVLQNFRFHKTAGFKKLLVSQTFRLHITSGSTKNSGFVKARSENNRDRLLQYICFVKDIGRAGPNRPKFHWI